MVPDPAKGPGKTKVVTEARDGRRSGSYSARVKATGGTVTVSATKEFMFFTPDKHSVSAVVGANISGINFSAFDNGTITGRVVDAADDPLSGVIVSATGGQRSAPPPHPAHRRHHRCDGGLHPPRALRHLHCHSHEGWL